MEIFDLLRSIEDSLQGVSCLPKEPFMKLGQGQAPVLNYSLEQKSAFSSYGHFQVDIDDSKFKANSNAVPSNNIFDQVEGMTYEQVRQELRHDLRRGDRRILRTVGAETLTHLELRNVESGDEETPLEIGRTGANTDEIAQAVTQGRVPITYKKMGKFKSVIREISRPATPKGKYSSSKNIKRLRI